MAPPSQPDADQGIGKPLLVSRAEAQQLLAIGSKHIFHQLVRDGRLPFVAIGRRRKFARADIEALIDREKRTWESTKHALSKTPESSYGLKGRNGISTSRSRGAGSATALSFTNLISTKPKRSRTG